MCTLNNPVEGIFYVMLYGSSSFSGLSLVGRFCGNGVCDRGENSTYCASDCSCGDGVCSSGETALNCAQDCSYCGDGICQSSWGETSLNCSIDCGGGTCSCYSTIAQCPMSVICPQAVAQ